MARKVLYTSEQILERAMLVFWQQGYLGTSMRDLVKATGLNPGSIYHSYGNKKALFISVTEHYYRKLSSAINQSINSDQSADETLRSFFDTILLQNEHVVARGCLLVNTLMEQSNDSDIQSHVSAMFSGFEEMFYWILIKGQKQGVVKPNLVARQEAQVLVNCYYGLRVQNLTEQPQENLQGIIQHQLDRLF